MKTLVIGLGKSGRAAYDLLLQEGDQIVGTDDDATLLTKLESEGIPVIVRQEAIGKFYAFTVDGLGEVKILVPSVLKEKALEIIGEIDLTLPSNRNY